MQPSHRCHDQDPGQESREVPGNYPSGSWLFLAKASLVAWTSKHEFNFNREHSLPEITLLELGSRKP